VVNGNEDQLEGQGEVNSTSTSSASQLQSYVGAGDEKQDHTNDETSPGDMLRRALLEAGVPGQITLPVLTSHSNSTNPNTFPSFSFSISFSQSPSPPDGLKRPQQNSILTVVPAKQRKNADRSTPSPSTPSSSDAGELSADSKRLKEWREKSDSEIAEVERVLEETSAKIDSEELEVIKLNNVLAGRRGKTTVSDTEHFFSQQAEKLERKSEIDSLSEEINRKMRSQNKSKYLALSRELFAARKEYLSLVQKEKKEVQAVIFST